MLLLALAHTRFATFLRAADAAGTPASVIAFTLDKPGRVSLAICDKDGIQVRTLRDAAPLETGKHEIVWDGPDWNGRRSWRKTTHGSSFRRRGSPPSSC